jgi:hypothetical protein
VSGIGGSCVGGRSDGDHVRGREGVRGVGGTGGSSSRDGHGQRGVRWRDYGGLRHPDIGSAGQRSSTIDLVISGPGHGIDSLSAIIAEDVRTGSDHVVIT